MKTKPDHNQTQAQQSTSDESSSKLNRREFLSGSVGIGATVLGAGVLAGAGSA